MTSSELATQINADIFHGYRDVLSLYPENRILVSSKFITYCMSSRDVAKLSGVCLADILNPFNRRMPHMTYNNYSALDSSFIPYPDLVYKQEYIPSVSKTYILSTLSDIGREETSVEEVKSRVGDWVVNQVFPLYLESLFGL